MHLLLFITFGWEGRSRTPTKYILYYTQHVGCGYWVIKIIQELNSYQYFKVIFCVLYFVLYYVSRTFIVFFFFKLTLCSKLIITIMSTHRRVFVYDVFRTRCSENSKQYNNGRNAELYLCVLDNMCFMRIKLFTFTQHYAADHVMCVDFNGNNIIT